jgi:hypothetical protein
MIWPEFIATATKTGYFPSGSSSKECHCLDLIDKAIIFVFEKIHPRSGRVYFTRRSFVCVETLPERQRPQMGAQGYLVHLANVTPHNTALSAAGHPIVMMPPQAALSSIPVSYPCPGILFLHHLTPRFKYGGIEQTGG